ncbi:MAG: DUF6603 domain-containing protein [Gemmatimonadota bacterium]
MTINAGQLDSFGLLAKALGILDETGNANSNWFGDPVGSDANPRGLRNILGNDSQREALVEFVDEVLGPPERAEREDAVWVPLFQESSPQVTIFAVIEPVDGLVRLGVGVQHATTGAVPTVATRIHVPLFQLARGSAPAPADAGDIPGWLLIGRPGGRIGITVDATLREGAPPAGEASLGGLAATLHIPTAAEDALAIFVELRDLQLPGATSPRTFTLDAQSLDQLGPDVFELLVGLVRAQANAIDASNPALRPFAALTGMLGLRTVTGLPPLPLAELPTRGIAAVVDWLETVLEENTARDAWLAQLATLLGATADAARDAVRFTIGPASITVGVRVDSGTAGHPVLTPWVEVALDGQPGARVRLAVDLFRANLATGDVLAVPDLRAEAVFGAAAGGSNLLTGDPQVGSLRVGLALTSARRPTFVLTLHDVTVAGRNHAVLDLSSPDAALDAAGDVVAGALASALDGLGTPGALVSALLGIEPPAGVTGVEATALLSDPLREITRYWRDLTANAGATAEVLGDFRRLIAGAAAAAVPGTGISADPWRIDLAPSIEIGVWRVGSELMVDVRATVTTPVLGDLEASGSIALSLLRANLDPPAAQFGVGVDVALALRRADRTTARFDIGPLALEFEQIGIHARWSPTEALAAEVQADGLMLSTTPDIGAPLQVELPLPRFSAGGLAFDTPDWDDVEAALAALLSTLQVPVIDISLRTIGWVGTAPRLRLAGLLGPDPSAEVEAWLAAALLNCQTLRAVLRPVATLLSGFQHTAPIGVGSARRPFRCPVAGEPRAPGLAAWLVPDCRPISDDIAPAVGELTLDVPPESAALVDALQRAALTLPDLADLLVGRDSLAEGFDLLVERWTGTDGLIGPPVSLPDGVSSIELGGFSYDELVALGSAGALVGDVLASAPTAVVHVGSEPSWISGRPAGSVFDASTAVAESNIPAAAAGEWFVRLPTARAAAAARPDRGAVGEQAARLSQILSSRTAPIVVVAYGECGAAAIRAAADSAQVSDVITVGSPWAGLALDSLSTGLSGDALRLLARLLRSDAVEWSDTLLAFEASPLETMRAIVQRASALISSRDEVPSAGSETRRAGLQVHAAFGVLDAETIATGMGALIRDGIAGRFELAAAGDPHPIHTELHVGIDLPVLDLDLGGVLVGAGATLELCSLTRSLTGTVETALVSGMILDLHFGVHDGWLLGGPGATQPAADVRWMSARIAIPFDGRPGDTELVLHEARAFSTFRERWVVRADADGSAATVALPEVRIVLSGVLARLRAASPDLASLLDVIGITRDGGLDPDALDRLLHDPVTSVTALRASASAQLATALRALVPAAGGSAAQISWVVGPATVSFDLAARTVSANIRATDTGLPVLDATVQLSPAGASAELALGTLDPNAGGIRLVGRVNGTRDLALEWQAPHGTTRRLELLPVLDRGSIEQFVTVVAPAALLHGLATIARQHASGAGSAALDVALETLGLLGVADERGVRALRLPIGLIDDPGAWLRHAGADWRTAPAATAVRLLDALAPIIAPARGTTPGWPITDDVIVQYAVEGDRLRLTLAVELDTTLDGTPITTAITGGLLIGTDAPPSPVVTAAVSVDGRGLRVEVTPTVRLFLDRPSPATPLQLYPDGPGLGSALQAAGETALPPILNALIAHRTDAASLIRDVGTAVFDLGGALELLESNQFNAARITSFAADPGARLLARLPHLVSTGTAALAHALDPAGTLIQVTGPTAGVLTLGFGATEAVQLQLDASTPAPALILSAEVDLPGVGRLALDSLRLSADGVQIAARIGPAALSVGALVLRPLVLVRAGVAAGSFTRMFGLGLAFDTDADTSVEFRWALDATPPFLAVITRGVTGEVPSLDPATVASRLLALAASLATGILVEELGPTLPARATDALRGVVFTDVPSSASVDPQLFVDLFDPPQLLNRLERLAWNAATAAPPFSLTIEDTVTIGLVGAPIGGGSRRHLGVNLSLAEGRRFAIATGDPTVELEVDADWVTPSTAPGLSIFVLEGEPGPGGAFDFSIVPGVLIEGIGLRFSKTSGPLLELGPISLDAIAVHVYGEAAPAGIGGGVHLQLDGFAIAPGGGGGDNAVANGIMNDARASGTANRPAFSPSLAIQHHPGDSGVAVSLRAGDPPGPWWVMVQRQLGPLYIEQVGFDTREEAGRVVRISLLFDGRVSLFGLTASVDQLSVTWLGGDVLDIQSWQVDLQGLAVSADMAGVALAGGLLKTTADGQISYVGMLLGRFGVYGLTVFGGYTDDHGSPSFFVFGALNGPIGGPPAFFVTGIGGGLGINRGLVVPGDFAGFAEYPFIQALDPAAQPPADPMMALRRLSEYFPPVRGNFWFAAGISFTCFSLVDGIAVVSVSFGDGLEINLLGLARMALPRPQAALVSIELGLIARFSTREGVFSIRAQLTDNSWLLYPDVRLTGGFAFVIWWKGPNRGQFVLTLGGYHPSFHREGYPDVPRLGLIWQVTDDIVIKGGSYFALTSEALMAGVEIEVSADFGWAWARIGFGAHGIVYFDPFWFEVLAYARISAGVKIKTWFGTIRFSISMGAQIRVWGPEFSGEARLSVGPASVTVGFGSERTIPQRVLSWPEFVTKYLEDAGGSARALSSITGKGTLPAATNGGVAAPTSDGSLEKPFEVFAEFEISVTTTVPVHRFDVGLTTGPVALPVVRSDGAPAALGLKPMRAGSLSSTVVLILERRTATGWTSAATALRLLGANLAAAAPRKEGSNLDTDAFPIAAWGAPEVPGLPAPPLPRGDVLFAGNRVRLVAEAATMDRGPEVLYRQVEASRRPLPLQAGGAARSALLMRAGEVEAAIPAIATTADALAAARTELFTARGDDALPHGLLPRGSYSNLARAAYVGDRTAPPLFGSLADGLAPANADDPVSERQTPPEPVVFAGMRPPVVSALLTAGAGVALRPESTTVANKRSARRTAPTLASVQARIAIHLPIRMAVTATPSRAERGTVVATGVVPRTDALGTARSYVAGPVGGLRGLDGIVAGIQLQPKRRRTKAMTNSALGAGDLVVMTLPDAALDIDETMRPAVAVDGTARVAMLRGDGSVAFDEIVADGSAIVPPGVALIGVQSGGSNQLQDGLSGWHASARIAALGSHAALGAGCILTVDAAGAGRGLGWSAANEIVADAGAVTTHFADDVRTIVVVLAGADPQRLDNLGLELLHARRALSANGAARKPTVVLRGSEAALIYAVEPDGTGPVTVRVRSGGDWRLAGVLGGMIGVDAVAPVLSERGPLAVVRRILAVDAGTARASWQPPTQVAPKTRKASKKTTKRTTKKTKSKKSKQTTAQKTKQTKKPKKVKAGSTRKRGS